MTFSLQPIVLPLGKSFAFFRYRAKEEPTTFQARRTEIPKLCTEEDQFNLTHPLLRILILCALAVTILEIIKYASPLI